MILFGFLFWLKVSNFTLLFWIILLSRDAIIMYCKTSYNGGVLSFYDWFSAKFAVHLILS